MTALQILCYAAVLLFLVVIVAKAIKYASTPLHLRWELYPVAHEKGRAEHGGSIFEEPEWWNKPREVDRMGELLEMFKEIFLLKGVWLNNRKMWYASYPFHMGLYLMTGWLALVILGGLLGLAGVEISGQAGGIGALVNGLTRVFGYAGFALAAIGAAGLFGLRLFDPELNKFNTPMEYVNLLFTGGVAVLAFIAAATADPSFAAHRAFAAELLRFVPGAGTGLPGIVKAEATAGVLLLAWIPCTRMSHFVAKYFLYHDVRWEDEPNPRGSPIERKVLQALDFGVSWSGPHIQAGKKWSEILMEKPENKE